MGYLINEIMRSSRFISASSDSIIKWSWSTTDKTSEIKITMNKKAGFTTVFIAISNDGEQVSDICDFSDTTFLKAVSKAYFEMKKGEFGKDIADKFDEVMNGIEKILF